MVFQRPSMRVNPVMLALPLLLLATGCGGEAEEHAATPNPPVAIWRPDSARASAGAGDTAAAGGGGLTGGALAAGERPGAAGGGSPRSGAEPSAGGSPSSGAPPAAAQSGSTAPPASGAAPDGGAPPAGSGAAPAAGSAEAILLRAERAYEAVRTLRADFVQDLTVPLLESTQQSRGEIFHRKPDRFLMRFSDPAGDVVVADGQYLWLYYPSNDPGQVMRTSMGQAGRIDLQREFLSNPTERFDATLVGSETVAGRPAKVLDLVPRTASPYRAVRIWIDDQDALARRFRITENNDAVRTVELRNLRVNVELSDELFSFTPPANAQVFEQ